MLCVLIYLYKHEHVYIYVHIFIYVCKYVHIYGWQPQWLFAHEFEVRTIFMVQWCACPVLVRWSRRDDRRLGCRRASSVEGEDDDFGRSVSLRLLCLFMHRGCDCFMVYLINLRASNRGVRFLLPLHPPLSHSSCFCCCVSSSFHFSSMAVLRVGPRRKINFSGLFTYFHFRFHHLLRRRSRSSSSRRRMGEGRAMCGRGSSDLGRWKG